MVAALFFRLNHDTHNKETTMKILKYLPIAAILLALGLSSPAQADGYSFPAGVHFDQVVGQVMEPNIGSQYTSLDAISFGFESRYVRICLRTNSVDSYFRFGTTFSTDVAQFNTALAGNQMIVYVTTSGEFIAGDGASTDFGALPMRAPTSTGNSSNVIEPPGNCITQLAT